MAALTQVIRARAPVAEFLEETGGEKLRDGRIVVGRRTPMNRRDELVIVGTNDDDTKPQI